MTNTAGQEYIGHARGAQGRTTTIGFLGARLTGELQSVRVVGRQDLTNTEKARDEFILLVLRGQRSLQESQFIKLLWFPPSGSRRRRKPITVDDTKLILIPLQSLNESQSRVATAMISDRPIVIAHGKISNLHFPEQSGLGIRDEAHQVPGKRRQSRLP